MEAQSTRDDPDIPTKVGDVQRYQSQTATSTQLKPWLSKGKGDYLQRHGM